MKTSRRNFLRNTSAAALALPVAGIASFATTEAASPIVHPDRHAGTASVPDTLDLVDRANLALNGLAGTLDWEGVPEFYFRVTLSPPEFIHDAISFCACGPKYWESFPMLRVMTGSDRFQDVQDRYAKYLLGSIEEDGLFYAKIGPARQWDKSSPEDYANIYGQGRMIRALLAQYYYDQNDESIKRAKKIAAKLSQIAVYKDQYAYFPTTPGYGDMFSYPKSGWKVTDLPRGPQLTGRNTLANDIFGIPMYLGGTILPLVRLYDATQSEETLVLSTKMTRFLMLPESGWLPPSYSRGVTPAEHAQYRGHFHGHVMALRGILANGVATQDTEAKEFARDGYEFSRQLGIARLGWFEEFAGKHSHETCCLADMVPLAIQLSEAGVGDYWDDVDGYVRNHLVEGQFDDLDRMKATNESITPAQEKLLERAVGTYCGWGTPTGLSTVLQNCCMANGSQALYGAWESMLRFRDGTAKLNLLLNRTSPWLDVDSYLPYEGRVVLHNKKAKRIQVRIPGWVDKGKVVCSVAGRRIPTFWASNYLVIEPMQPWTSVTIAFPIREEKQSVSFEDFGDFRADSRAPIGTYGYDITYRAGTAVKVIAAGGNPRLTYDRGKPNVAPVYLAYQNRERLRGDIAPMRKANRPVTSTLITTW
jgi:hypothetical protein